MEQKFETFLEVAQALNKHGITPILFGSLGLWRVIGKPEDINDIDVVLPNEILVKNFEKLEDIMQDIGFTRDKYYKHEFIKGDERVGYEEEKDLTDVNIKLNNLKETTMNGIRFLELSAQDYLKVYNQTLVRWENKVVGIKNKLSALEKVIKN